MPSPEMFGPASLALSQTVSAFQGFLPHLTDVRKASPTDPDMAGDVHLGEIAASALAIGIGAVASSLTGNYIPVTVSVLVAFTLICVYESALRQNRPMDPHVISVEREDDGTFTLQ